MLTDKDIKRLKSDRPSDLDNAGVEDLRYALRRNQKYVEDLSDQEIADILNQVAARQPKATRGEPTQAIAESKKRRKIRIRVKRK